MKFRSLLAVPAVAVTLGLVSPPGLASPVGATRGASPPDGIVHKTAGCHRSCEWGPVLGWHRHVGDSCRPIACVPRAEEPGRCWVDRWGERRCRW
jgi:hypothetical protein